MASHNGNGSCLVGHADSYSCKKKKKESNKAHRFRPTLFCRGRFQSVIMRRVLRFSAVSAT